MGKKWHGNCVREKRLCDNLVSYLQSFLSLIRLHKSAAFLFPSKISLSAVFFILVFFGGSAEAADISIPVLCYHQVLPKANGLFEVSTADFKNQLSLIKARGYKAINSAQLLDFLSGKSKPVGKVIVISFDDGYKSVFQYAFPIMKEFDFVGVACIYPQFIEGGGGMSWENLRQLASAGWTIECHSYSHSDLSKTPAGDGKQAEFFFREIGNPKKIIEKAIGSPVRLIVWPYGIYTEDSEKYAKEQGYLGAFTVDGGANYPGLDPFRIKRQVIYRTDNMEKFTIRLEMGALEVKDPTPRPGQVVSTFTGMECCIPSLSGQDFSDFVLNVKITGGSLNSSYDPATQNIKGTPNGKKISAGQHFIDVYLRDKRTGITCQNGWLFTIK